MKRWVAIVPAVCGLLLGGLALGSRGVQAGEKDGEHAEKKIEKIKIVRAGGGSFLGVGVEEVEGDARGAKVRSVEPDSAAQKAGIEEGDVITRFDGVDVRSSRQLVRLVQETPAGRAVEVQVRRDGADKTLTATIGEGGHTLHAGARPVFLPDMDAEDFEVEVEVEVPDMPPLPHGAMPHVFQWHGEGDHDFALSWVGRPRLGIRFMEIEGQLADYFDLTADEGVLVSSVEEGSPAAEAGLQAGDVVLEFGGEVVRDGRDLKKQVQAAEPGSPVTVKVQRDGKPHELQVTLPEPEKPQTIRRSTGVSL